MCKRVVWVCKNIRIENAYNEHAFHVNFDSRIDKWVNGESFNT